MSQHIVIVEDDVVTRRRLAAQLKQQMYRVSEAEDAAAMEAILARDPADLLLVDINLEGKDGLTITREQRARSNAGIILLTGRTDQIDRIVGLELGADDYVTKPFDKRELFARIKNLLSRVRDLKAFEAEQTEAAPARFGRWSLDRARRRLVDEAGALEALTRAEYELLAAFAENPGVILSRDRLLDMIQNQKWAPDNRTIDVLVGRLRKKIEPDPSHPEWIITIHGEGYMLAELSGT
jgi:two-component system, OmpR family, torCAD operon response regulator TorR